MIENAEAAPDVQLETASRLPALPPPTRKEMPPPYRSDEIAAALIEMARTAGVRLDRVEVVSDDQAQIWIVQIATGGAEEQRLTFPYSSARGIYTPGEIARHLVNGSWPFG